MSYSPFVSTLYHRIAAGPLAVPAAIAIAEDREILTSRMAADTDSPLTTPFQFSVNDRPRVLKAALFCNLADGLVLNAPSPVISCAIYLAQNLPAGINPVAQVVLPALNTWIEVEDSLQPIFNALPANPFGIYASIGGSLDTQLVDPGLAPATPVEFQFAVQVAHTFALQ